MRRNGDLDRISNAHSPLLFALAPLSLWLRLLALALARWLSSSAAVCYLSICLSVCLSACCLPVLLFPSSHPRPQPSYSLTLLLSSLSLLLCTPSSPSPTLSDTRLCGPASIERKRGRGTGLVFPFFFFFFLFEQVTGEAWAHSTKSTSVSWLTHGSWLIAHGLMGSLTAHSLLTQSFVY